MRQFVLTLSLACITLVTGQVPIGHAQSDMDAGGMSGGGMGGPSKRQAANPPRFAVVDLPIDEQMEELSPRQSARATVFHYELGSYKPTVQRGNQAGKSSIEIWAFETQPDEENGEGQIEVLVPLELAVHPNTVNKLSNGRIIIMAYPGGMGGFGMGPGGMGGMGGMMGGMGKSGSGMGGYGGGEMGGMGGYGGEGGYGDEGGYGGGPQEAILVLNIGMGGMGGYGDDYGDGYGGDYGDMGGYGGDDGAMGMGGMGMGGMGMSGMMGGTMQSTVRCYVPLATLAQAKQQTGAKLQLPPQEVEVVSSVIRQNITRRQLVEGLQRDLSDTVAVEKIEVRLKQLLAEEYDTQLKRQELEISEIEKRASELREELGRRKAAKERVVDVQLGRIILEAQGLLGK